ncbi:MAG: EAL domain-containing protein [Kofleriaceae bacterium]|nr:EAL domain-containing protein [Kofleriaceae bacterium]
MRRAIRRWLGPAGFDVEEAGGADEATRIIESHPIDAVLSDVQMPDGGGVELLRAIRRIALDLPVVFLTGVPDVDTAAAAVELGAFRFLVKPPDPTGLIDVMRDACQAHALARLRREALAIGVAARQAITDRAGLEVRLDNAVGSLWLAYQPIIEPRTGAIFGLEGLMRSDEPTMRGPDAVLDAAHRTGRIGDVGRQVRALAAAGLARRDSPAALFINLHPDELLADDLVGDGPLAGHAARIVLEITERASLPSSALLSRRIAELRALGFRIAIDDIGAGYSGLTTFADLAPEIVKIDMALVRNVHDAPIKRRTIRSLCELCHDMGSLVVAEGVEVGEERDVLLDLGCDLLQGFLFGRPERLVS